MKTSPYSPQLEKLQCSNEETVYDNKDPAQP